MGIDISTLPSEGERVILEIEDPESIRDSVYIEESYKKGLKAKTNG